jgi:hypothetical protein
LGLVWATSGGVPIGLTHPTRRLARTIFVAAWIYGQLTVYK